MNRSLRSLSIDHNALGNAGVAPMEAFIRGVMMNVSLQHLDMSNNKLGMYVCMTCMYVCMFACL